VTLVLIGILSVQFGAAGSKGLFGEIPPVGMVLLRLVTSSLILLLALARPRLGGRTAADWRPVLGARAGAGAMNWAFYESFARIPLGGAVSIEFVGPLAVAAVGRRRPRDLVWVGLAALGVLLFGAGPTRVDALGFGLALFAGGCWALYMVSTVATGSRWAGVEGLAVASMVATLAIAPIAVAAASARLLEPRLLVLGALVGLLSSVIPYGLRDGRPPQPAAQSVRRLDESRTGHRGAGGRRPPPRVAHPAATDRDGLRDCGERGRRSHDG
jgi:inner membrane transporter RhtA